VIKIEFAKKDFSYYWNIIKIPLFVLIGWSVLAVIVAKMSTYWHQSIFGTWQGLVVQLIVFGFIGYTIIAEHKGSVKQSAWAGAITGVIAGFVGAILAVIMFYLVPQIYELSINQAVAQGAPAELVRNIIRIGLYTGFITGPLFAGLIGAAISAISGVVTKKLEKK